MSKTILGLLAVLAAAACAGPIGTMNPMTPAAGAPGITTFGTVAPQVLSPFGGTGGPVPQPAFLYNCGLCGGGG